jgi:phosphatidylserine decarboxylase
VIPFVVVALAVGALVVAVCMLFRVPCGRAVWPGVVIAAVFTGYFLYFFRDPERTAPADPDVIVAGADGVIMRIMDVREDKHLKTDCVRISIFLSLFDVHVNRAPIAGMSTFLGYVPGKHFFTFQEKSSDHNQHNAILIEGERTRCLVYQIVGPVARRVVYWPDHDKAVALDKGTRIGMMKFGSRLDMYFPKADITVMTKVGDTVRAGETIVARIGRGGAK